MARKLAVIMDPIGSIHYAKDTTLAMLLEAQARGWQLFHLEPADLALRGDQVSATAQPLTVNADPQDWYRLGPAQTFPLSDMDAVLMRKDPPFDMDYIYCTYLLELAEKNGVLVVNRPRSLRDCNEKLFAAWFPQCMPETLVAARAEALRSFIDALGDVILKPLGGMGGASVFRLRGDDPNINVVIETLTGHGQHLVMAQRYLPEIRAGDKRIILIDGEPVPGALARIPAEGETRANLATGGTGQAVELSERDRWICAQVGPALRERGLLFVGLDVIGDYLTEINVTSPTGVRQLDALFGFNISARLFDAIEARLTMPATKGARS